MAFLYLAGSDTMTWLLRSFNYLEVSCNYSILELILFRRAFRLLKSLGLLRSLDRRLIVIDNESIIKHQKRAVGGSDTVT